MKLGALIAPGRERGGERSRVCGLYAGYVVLVVETRWKNYTEIRVLIRFHRVVLSQLDSLRAGKNAETFVNFKTSLWMVQAECVRVSGPDCVT